jgi:hypothetical protein
MNNNKNNKEILIKRMIHLNPDFVSSNKDINEALTTENTHQAYNDIIAFIRNKVKSLNNDEVYELHEELKKWFDKWI